MEKCPYCGKIPMQTANCYKYNPVGDCQLAKRGVRHQHHYCGPNWPNPNHAWIEVIKEEK